MGKVKIDKEELEELNKKYQLLLFYNAQITQICMMHTGKIVGIDYNNLDERMLIDLFLKFNIHAFTSYFDKYFIGKYKIDLEKQPEFLVGWNKHLEKNIKQIYNAEIKKLKELQEKRKNPTRQNYIS